MARPRKSLGGKSAKEKLLEASFSLIRSKGYAATSVDELCLQAKVTKGSFFHYFSSKEQLAVEAAQHWSKVTAEFFRGAPYHAFSDPLDRFLGYIEFRKAIIQGPISGFTCLAGTMIQETYASHPEIREACYESVFHHAELLEQDIHEAVLQYQPRMSVNPKDLALYTQAVLQGAFILAKANDDKEVAHSCIDHLIQHIHLLFRKDGSSGKSKN